MRLADPLTWSAKEVSLEEAEALSSGLAVLVTRRLGVTPDAPRVLRCPCPHCGARMIVIEVFARGCEPRWRPTPSTIDTS